MRLLDFAFTFNMSSKQAQLFSQLWKPKAALLWSLICLKWKTIITQAWMLITYHPHNRHCCSRINGAGEDRSVWLCPVVNGVSLDGFLIKLMSPSRRPGHTARYGPIIWSSYADAELSWHITQQTSAAGTTCGCGLKCAKTSTATFFSNLLLLFFCRYIVRTNSRCKV